MKSKRLFPNFIYIGPDKAGSTWIYHVLGNHPKVFLSPAKELFYFDLYYEKGRNWYLQNFKNARSEHLIVGEISHDYLFSIEACERIANDLPGIKLMVCLREPVERAFSAYLFMLRQGRVQGSFEQALEIKNELIDHGLYAKHMEPYLKIFGRKRIHIGIFDDLKSDPIKFLKKLYEFLDIETMDLTKNSKQKVLPASRPRIASVAKCAKLVALKIRQLGYPIIVNRIKSIILIQKLLYKTFDELNKPQISVATKRSLKTKFKKDILKLDSMLGLHLEERWGYK